MWRFMICRPLLTRSPVSFKLENIETNLRFAAITQSGNACVLVRMRIDMGTGADGLKSLFHTQHLNLSVNCCCKCLWGKIWTGLDLGNSLTNELYMTDVYMQAVMGEKTVMLRDMLNWKREHW